MRMMVVVVVSVVAMMTALTDDDDVHHNDAAADDDEAPSMNALWLQVSRSPLLLQVFSAGIAEQRLRLQISCISWRPSWRANAFEMNPKMTTDDGSMVGYVAIRPHMSSVGEISEWICRPGRQKIVSPPPSSHSPPPPPSPATIDVTAARAPEVADSLVLKRTKA